MNQNAIKQNTQNKQRLSSKFPQNYFYNYNDDNNDLKNDL